MSDDPRLTAFLRWRDALDGAAKEASAQLASALAEDVGLKVHSVTARVKDPASLATKLARPDRTYASLFDVTDLVGVRVIAYFEDDVERIGRLVERTFAVDLTASTDKRKRLHDATFGYSSLHYVCTLPRIDGGDDGHARFEIQVRTVLEHAWAEIEHDLGYKAAETPPAIARRFRRLAGLLEIVDQEFIAIRDELGAYARALPTRLAEDDDAVVLDQLSLPSLVALESTRALDTRIAAALGASLAVDVFYPDYLVRMLALAGLTTVGAARRGLALHAETIAAMPAAYATFARATFDLELHRDGALPRGYALFFLAHAAVLARDGLTVSKVERLARFYQALDYPDDEKAAQRIASELVAALARP